MLNVVYLEQMPRLFEFAAAHLPDPDKILLGLLKPVWIVHKHSLLPQDRTKDWFFSVSMVINNLYASNGRFSEEIINDEKCPNLFLLKTIAAAQILKSPRLQTLKTNPETGEKIAKKFCKFFSQMMEDFRQRADSHA